MKKVVLFLLAALMCLSFVACESDELLITVPDPVHDLLAINANRFGECIDEVVELTVENWKDYIGVFSYTEDVVEKDAFGEVISTQTVEHRIIGVETDRYHRCEEVVIELKNTETEELIVFQLNGDYRLLLENHGNFIANSEKVKNFDISKYECTRIKGRIYFVTLPEGSIEVIEDEKSQTAHRRINVCKPDLTLNISYTIDSLTKEIYHNGNENWQEVYMTK